MRQTARLPFDLGAGLATRRAKGLFRERLVVEPGPDPERPQRVRVAGRDCIAFCSNDYLGLSRHPVVSGAFASAARRHGVGAGASQLVSGFGPEQRGLEEELADFVGRPRALVFSTGYMANLGVVTALVGRGDQVLEDRLNHASLLDAGLASGARFRRYPHASVAGLGKALSTDTAGRSLVVTDGVFSMDGDVAPLAGLARVASRNRAWLMVDDAHAFGVLGPGGRGATAEAGLGSAAVPVLVATFGKALGTFGAFVAGSEALVETLVQAARTLVYTTAPPPAVAAATRAALALARDEHWRRQRLATLIDRFRSGADSLGLPLLSSRTPIQPLPCGTPEAATGLADGLREAGLLVGAMRPPTVPTGTSRLRITLSATHDDQEVDRLLEALARLLPADTGDATDDVARR